MKIIATTFFTLCLFMSSACSDFLEEELVGSHSNASFYKTETHALLAVNGIYNIISFVSTDNAL
ncbi:MAG: RagB/SusD family nutrient uptake outer membrane protein, partial [Bacteroidetes bacterium]|nr:RagB/SusD family nutrient uptake outer membrane protein [Bacteroidota bacterium]